MPIFRGFSAVADGPGQPVLPGPLSVFVAVYGGKQPPDCPLAAERCRGGKSAGKTLPLRAGAAFDRKPATRKAGGVFANCLSNRQ